VNRSGQARSRVFVVLSNIQSEAGNRLAGTHETDRAGRQACALPRCSISFQLGQPSKIGA
jgi:hypothetical protein